MDPTEKSEEERRRYVHAFNSTMLKIWKEQTVKLKVIDSGRLFRSIIASDFTADGKITRVNMKWKFHDYGIYQDRGTGRDTPRGNSGDIGRPKIRERRPWQSRKFYASYRNILDFFADNLGHEFCGAIPTILGSKDI